MGEEDMTRSSDNEGGSGGADDTRRPDANAARQDPRNAARQRQIAADSEAIQAPAARTAATTPADIRTRARESQLGEPAYRARFMRTS
jgi:hypothetical protein